VRRAVVGASVGLDLDDPALAPSGFVVAHQARAEQDASDLRGLARELGPVEDAQAVLPG
jgi:hypothetical protein